MTSLEALVRVAWAQGILDVTLGDRRTPGGWRECFLTAPGVRITAGAETVEEARALLLARLRAGVTSPWVCEDCGAAAGRPEHEDAPTLCARCFARRYPPVTVDDLDDGETAPSIVDEDFYGDEAWIEMRPRAQEDV